MLSLLQLTFIRPAVTPEDVCILRDEITFGHPITPICLQILIPVTYPGTWLKLWDAVPLDEEEFGLANHKWACISSDKTSDIVQMQTYDVGVCTQEMICCPTANDATDEAVTF